MSRIKKDITAHSGDEEVRIPLLDEGDMRSLKKSRYEELNGQWTMSYVIRHKSGKMAELRAMSPVHACSLIGWRPRHVTVVSKEEVSQKGSTDDRPAEQIQN